MPPLTGQMRMPPIAIPIAISQEFALDAGVQALPCVVGPRPHAKNLRSDLLRVLYGALGLAISLLYEATADNGGMETHTNRSFGIGWRTVGIILSALLFVLSLVELMLRPDSDAAIWRGLALSSLYLTMCLSQRRLFVPARARDNRRGRW